MASPRIFISSTFYDLRQVRSDIERSILELGYEPVRHETGAIPYLKDEPLESGAYREIDLSDVIVFIMGGRSGSQSEEYPGYSISQAELKRALGKGIQVFIFVESDVLNEYKTYKLNKNSEEIKYSSVDDVTVFPFLEELYSLPVNNPITPFEVANDISSFLKQQFAGLFHRFLQEQKRQQEVNVLEEMHSVAKTLNELVRFLTVERKNSDAAIKSILLADHPAFRRLAELTKTPYRVFFTTRKEMGAWLEARKWGQLSDDQLSPGNVDEWEIHRGDKTTYLIFTKEIFDDNDRLLPFTVGDWQEDWIQQLTQAESDFSEFVAKHLL